MLAVPCSRAARRACPVTHPACRSTGPQPSTATAMTATAVCHSASRLEKDTPGQPATVAAICRALCKARQAVSPRAPRPQLEAHLTGRLGLMHMHFQTEFTPHACVLGCNNCPTCLSNSSRSGSVATLATEAAPLEGPPVNCKRTGRQHHSSACSKAQQRQGIQGEEDQMGWRSVKPHLWCCLLRC